MTYGGPCPKCFAEIPGEEAPTDPGAEARAVQERRDRRGATLRAFVGLAMMAAVVGCAGITALGVVLWPEPEVAVLDFDSMGYDYPEIELTGKPEVSENDGVAQADPEPSNGGPEGTPRPRKPDINKLIPGYDGGDKDDPNAGLGTEGVADGGGPRSTRGGTDGPMEGPKDIDDIKGPGTTVDDLLEADLGPDVGRRGEVLTDADAIRQMIGKTMQLQMAKLKPCYERELKKDASLGGRWLLKYTVTKDGKAVRASATGRDTSNSPMEQCIASTIEKRWKFDRIVRDQPVQKTIAFRPG